MEFIILDLPLELQLEVVSHLAFPEKIRLKITREHFNNPIKPLTHKQLLISGMVVSWLE
jgi:hypothetical protein